MPTLFPDSIQMAINKHPKKWFIVSSLVIVILLALDILNHPTLFTSLLFGFSVTFMGQSLYIIGKEHLSRPSTKK